MKKLTSLILTLSIALALSACSDSGNSSTEGSNVSFVKSSESEIKLTFEEKFRGLDQELRYDEIIKLLGEPDEKGGENVKYLSYKQDENKKAIVQFLYGDNPRIDYTYITDTATKEEEFILHRRICDHENNYCSHDIYYSEEMRAFIDKCKEVKQGMSTDEVIAILGEPDDIFGGAVESVYYYFLNGYHTAFLNFRYIQEPEFHISASMVYLTDRKASRFEWILHADKCDDGFCYCEPYISQSTAENEQRAFVYKLEDSQLKETDTRQYILDYIGEPDEELNDGDVTRLVYNISDGRTGYICLLKRGTDTIIDCSYTYDPAEKKITYFTEISESCDLDSYYEYHKNE